MCRRDRAKWPGSGSPRDPMPAKPALGAGRILPRAAAPWGRCGSGRGVGLLVTRRDLNPHALVGTRPQYGTDTAATRCNLSPCWSALYVVTRSDTSGRKFSCRYCTLLHGRRSRDLRHHPTPHRPPLERAGAAPTCPADPSPPGPSRGTPDGLRSRRRAPGSVSVFGTVANDERIGARARTGGPCVPLRAGQEAGEHGRGVVRLGRVGRRHQPAEQRLVHRL